MKTFDREYEKTVRDNFEECQKSYKAQREYILNSTAQYHGVFVKTLCIPKIFSKEQWERLKYIAEFTHKILEKTIRRYKKDENFREKFGFDKELEQLILQESYIDSLLPVERVDIFFNEETGDFKFCEINTDGTSAMNEDRELNLALKKTYAFGEFAKAHKTGSFELFDSFVREFMDIYGSYKFKRPNPRVAIVDFLDLGTSNEFEQFRLAFERAGVGAEICDIRKLEYKDGVLYSEKGNRIDAIYRRAVTCDIMNNIDSIPDFIKAVKNHGVCLIGPLSTQIVHSKVFFQVVSDENNLTYLDSDEIEFVKKHFPKTYRLKDDNPLIDLKSILANKDKWIVKPVDSYGSRGVFAGVECSDGEWSEKLTRALEDGEHIIQEFCKPYETVNIDYSQENPRFENYSNLSGLFVYNGKFAGVYSRASKTEIISTRYSEIALATITAE